MGLVGGSILKVHIAGRAFPVAADADATLYVGGWELTPFNYGDGTTTVTMARKEWSVSGLELAIDDARDDLGFLQTVQANGRSLDIVLELASGAVWNGRAYLVGPAAMSTMKSTAPITLAAESALQKAQSHGEDVAIAATSPGARAAASRG